MYNIDQEVYVKGTIIGVTKTKDGSFEYEVQVKDNFWDERTIHVKDDQIKLAAITMDELEKICR